MAEEIDAVYTWVDGADPAVAAQLRRYAGSMAGSSSRYRNNGELRFSLRTLLRHAPWVRRIHILTDGQRPRWLDCSHPRIHLVTHAEVYPEPQWLPVFNSHAIEMCLHRIPGLSRRFLYLNDDFFLCRDVAPRDFFFENGGQAIFVQERPLASDRDGGSAHDRACAHTQAVLNARWGAPPQLRRLPTHTPQAYDRDLLFELENVFQDEFRRTAAHRFRSPDDVVLNVLYCYSLLESPVWRGAHKVQLLPDRTPQYRLFMLERRFLRTMHAYERILREQPRFLCINDDLEGSPPYHPLLLSLRAFLQLCFLGRSEVERR
jgi:hypothetical protein